MLTAMLQALARLSIDVWSDIACPWCFVGKRRLERALETFPERSSVEVVWRSFELDPSAPRQTEPGLHAERLARKYGSSVAEAEKRIARLVELARSDGISFDFERIRPGNTFDAHRVLHHAREVGLHTAVKERFLRGYLEEGRAIGDPEVLLSLAVDAGLDADAVSGVLSSGAHSDDVRADEAEAQRLGINGVPFFVIGGRYAVSGAQPAELLGRAISQAYAELSSRPIEFAEGASCEPDGC